MIGAEAYALQVVTPVNKPFSRSRCLAVETWRGSSPHEASEESNPVEVETEVVRVSQGEDSEGLGFVLAVNWVAKLGDIFVLEGVCDLLLGAVVALKGCSCLSSMS